MRRSYTRSSGTQSLYFVPSAAVRTTFVPFWFAVFLWPQVNPYTLPSERGKSGRIVLRFLFNTSPRRARSIEDIPVCDYFSQGLTTITMHPVHRRLASLRSVMLCLVGQVPQRSELTPRKWGQTMFRT